MPRGIPKSGEKRVPRKAERQQNRPSSIDPHQLYSVEEVCAALAISIQKTWNLYRDGKLRTVKIGNRTLVRGYDLISFIDGLPVANPVEVVVRDYSATPQESE